MSLFSYDGQAIDHFYTYDGQEIQVGTSGVPSPNVIASGQAACTLLHEGVYGQATQGSCIDDDGNIYVIYPGRGYILQYNVETKTATVHTGVFSADAYGHANDLCYNPNNGYIYIASGNSDGAVFVVDPADNFALKNTYYCQTSGGTGFTNYFMCYDRETDNFITFGEKMRRYSQTFALLSEVDCEYSRWDYTKQGIETDGQYIYCSVSQNTVNGHDGVMNGVDIFDMDGTYVGAVEFSDQTTELESIIYDWNTGLWYCSVNRPNENNIYGAGPNIYFVNMKAYYTPSELEAAADVLNVSTT